MGIRKAQGIEFTNENELARDIYWRIYQYQNKGQPKSDATIQETAEPAIQETAEPAIQETAEPAIQETAEPAIESKQESVKDTELVKTAEIKPELIKAEVQPKINSPVVSHAKSSKVEQKYKFSSKRTVVLLVALGAIIAVIFSVYVSVYLPQQVKVNVTTTPQLITPSQPTTIAEQQQYSFLRAWGSSGSGDGQFSNPQGVAVDSSGDV